MPSQGRFQYHILPAQEISYTQDVVASAGVCYTRPGFRRVTPDPLRLDKYRFATANDDELNAT